MPHNGSVLGRPVTLGKERYPRRGHCLAGYGFDLGNDPGGNRGPDDVVSAVVLDSDAMDGLDVDGVESMDRRVQVGTAQATQSGMVSPPMTKTVAGAGVGIIGTTSGTLTQLGPDSGQVIGSTSISEEIERGMAAHNPKLEGPYRSYQKRDG